MSENKKKILIIEDEKPMARVLELKMNNSGFEAKAFFNGQEGLEALEREKFDLIFIDLMMPVMNGFKFLEEAQKRKIETPIVILSNLGQEEDEKRAKELGAKDFFVKSNTPILEIVNYAKNFLIKGKK